MSSFTLFHIYLKISIFLVLGVRSHLPTTTQTFHVVSIISYFVRNGLHGYQYNCSHTTAEKDIVVVKCERTLICFHPNTNTIFPFREEPL